jgi:transcriptional regulator with XRE-family HTH domain
MSQRALADELGIWPAVLCHWESNARSIKVDALMRIAAALGVAAASLLPDSN